jgi:hypothetical protein
MIDPVYGLSAMVIEDPDDPSNPRLVLLGKDSSGRLHKANAGNHALADARALEAKLATLAAGHTYVPKSEIARCIATHTAVALLFVPA